MRKDQTEAKVLVWLSWELFRFFQDYYSRDTKLFKKSDSHEPSRQKTFDLGSARWSHQDTDVKLIFLWTFLFNKSFLSRVVGVPGSTTQSVLLDRAKWDLVEGFLLFRCIPSYTPLATIIESFKVPSLRLLQHYHHGPAKDQRVLVYHFAHPKKRSWMNRLVKLQSFLSAAARTDINQ